MEEKINIAEILKDKPQGTKLYSILSDGECFLNEASEDSIYIDIDNRKRFWCFTVYGSTHSFPNGCVLLFPSREMRDWEKFAWKKGDVLVSEGRGKLHVIFEAFNDDTYTTFKGKHFLCNYDGNEDYNEEDYNDYNKEVNERTIEFKKDNDDDAQTYINTIEERFGGKINRETLEVEKPQPEFKEGDVLCVRCEDDSFIEIFNYSKKNGDLYDHASLNTRTQVLDISGRYKIHKDEIVEIRIATDSEKQQLFAALEKKGKAWDAEKKEVTDLKPKVELKPFDKVLVRDSKSDNWRANLFGYIGKKDGYYHCVYANWAYCIPYTGNESLLGTTKDVEG